MTFTKIKMSIRNPPMFGYYNVPNTRLISSHNTNINYSTKAPTNDTKGTHHFRKGSPSPAMVAALRTVEMIDFQAVQSNTDSYLNKVIYDERELTAPHGSNNPQYDLSLEPIGSGRLRTDNNKQVKLWENGVPSEYNKLITPNDITKMLFLATGTVYKINEQNLELYQTAFVHKSFMKCFGYQPIGNQVHNLVYSYKPKYSYERQEYVGDRVIDLVVAEYLFERYPKKAEGFMTDMKKKLVKNQTLKTFGAFLGFSEYILLSDHIEKIGGRNNSKQFLANIFEAFCYAVKKDQGLDVAEKFIIGVIEKNVNFEELEHNNDNYKDILLRLFQKKKWGFPTYSIINKTGPGHKMQFTVGVNFIQDIDGVPTKINGRYFGVGNDRCKKGAEQLASKITLEMLTKK